MTKEEAVTLLCEHFSEGLVRTIVDALKQEQGEPVGKFAKFTDGTWREVTDYSSGVFLYTHPKEWVGLTYEEMQEILLDPKFQLKPLIAHAVETKLKEKNNG